MNESNQQLRSAEYASLRDELLKNKQYIFERPLAIIAVAGVASTQLSGQSSVVFLPLLLAILLLSNLWFTGNRLRSGSRIAAYIAVALEPAAGVNWRGWENSLRDYRIWTKKGSHQDREAAIRGRSDQHAVPDAMMFYPPLWLLHLVTALVALGMSVCSVYQGESGFAPVALALTFAVTAVTLYCCIWPYHPQRMRGLIEENRAIWQEVLEAPRDQESATRLTDVTGARPR